MVATVNLTSSILFHDAAEVERLVRDFETASIAPVDWRHRDHVAVATWYLLTRPGEAVRRRELARAGWAHGSLVRDNTLDAYIARLRRKLRTLGTAAQIATVRGVGYRIG